VLLPGKSYPLNSVSLRNAEHPGNVIVFRAFVRAHMQLRLLSLGRLDAKISFQSIEG